MFALPSWLHRPPDSTEACFVPVFEPRVAVPIVRSFAPLAPVCGVSLLRLDQFQLELHNHPDQFAINYVISGVQHGFRIGFDTPAITLRCVSSNMRSTAEHPSVIDSYLQTEVSSPLTVQYVSIDAFIDGIMSRGRGTLMAKFNVASVYRNVGIHQSDRPLLGMKWREQYFVDMALPFGLRSAPFIFTAIADLVEWILVHNYVVEFLRP